MPIPAAFDLSGRVAVVTGAGGPDGIGFATARLLAELGAAVMISATTARIQDRVSELRSAGFDAAGIIGDLTDADGRPGWCRLRWSNGGGWTSWSTTPA